MAYRNEFDAIGTHWCVDILEDVDGVRAERLAMKIHDRIDAFDKAYSRFRADSLVTQMSKNIGTFLLPSDATPMMELYRKLYDATNGMVTPLIGNALSDAGYDAEYSLVPKPMTALKPWDSVMRFTDPILTLSEPALLDFGAAGKGYLIDIVSDILRTDGIESFCVDAGGDMCYRSAAGETMRVGLENPVDTSQAVGVASILNKSICGSAGNRRAWGEFHHILDPGTLTSPKHILAVWVVADTTMLADGLTTALMFVAPNILQKEFNFEYAILHADFSITASTNFPGEFFPE